MRSLDRVRTARKWLATGGYLTTTLLVMLAAPLAQAAGNEAKERAARKACLSGDYAAGVEILSDLFIDTKDPTHIFNQARCFEQNGRCEDAISRFREYLRKATGISSELKADTEKHIVDCQALISPNVAPARSREGETSAAASKVTAPTQVPTAPSVEPRSMSVAGPTAMPAPVQVALASDAAPADNSGQGLRIAGITCGVVGVASVGTAVYFYARARSLSDKVSGETPHNPSDVSAGQNAESMQWIFYGVGAAAIATGTVLYVLRWKAADSGRPSAFVAPILGPGLAGISAQGVF